MIKTSLTVLLDAIENHLSPNELDSKEDEILVVTSSLESTDDGFYYLTKDKLLPLQISEELMTKVMNEVDSEKDNLEQDPFDLFISFR